MSRLNAFFELIEDPQTPPWKKRLAKEDKPSNRNMARIKQLDADEKKRLSLIQQKFDGLLKFDSVLEKDGDPNNNSLSNSYEEYPDDDEYNAFNLQDEENVQFNQIGIDAIFKALSKKKKSNFEVKLLSHALMHNPFFKKMRKQITETLYQDLFKEIYLESFNSLDTVFKFGDMGDKFYIILQGDVYILSPSQLGKALQEIEKEKQQQAIEKLKIEQSQQKNGLPVNTNRNSLETQQFAVSPRMSASSKFQATEEDEKTPTSFSSPFSPKQQSKRYQEDLRKYAINKNLSKVNNESFSMSTDQILNTESKNEYQSPTKNVYSERQSEYIKNVFSEKQQEQNNITSEQRSRSSSSQNSGGQSSRSRLSSSYGEGKASSKQNLEQKVFQKYPNFYIVKQLCVGDNFGEIALRTDKERTATVVCKTNCRFAVISKSGFQRILGGRQYQF